jgi:hypothetical protein
MYPWPTGDFDNAMNVALDIAMDYLESTGQAVRFFEVQRMAATAIVAAWNAVSGIGSSSPTSRSRRLN